MDVFLDTCGRRGVKTVLCFYLLLVHAAADCPRPGVRENLILSNEALLMNDFLEGSDVTLECWNGYVIDSGSGVITCIDGKWTEPDLVCKKKDCGHPPLKPQMKFTINEGTLFGASLTVFCEEGYQVIGTEHKKCYASGWSGSSSCEIITCEIPAEMTNGRILWDSEDEPKYGESVWFDCDEGFSLVGMAGIVCGDDGEYESPAPQCQRDATEETNTAPLTPTVGPHTPGVTKSLTTVLPETAHRDIPITISRTPTVPASIQGGRDFKSTEEKARASVTSATPFREESGVDAHKDSKYLPVIISVVFVSLAGCLVALCLHKFLLRKKGSYDTREDLKPELLHFQNL